MAHPGLIRREWVEADPVPTLIPAISMILAVRMSRPVASVSIATASTDASGVPATLRADVRKLTEPQDRTRKGSLAQTRCIRLDRKVVLAVSFPQHVRGRAVKAAPESIGIPEFDFDHLHSQPVELLRLVDL